MKKLFYCLCLLLIFSCQDNDNIENIENQQAQVLSSLQELKDKYQISADPCDRCYVQAYGVCKNIGKEEAYQKCMNDPNKHQAFSDCKANCKQVLKPVDVVAGKAKSN